MAKKNRDYKPEEILYPNQNIVESELVNEMKTSYIDYAMSVIVGRALPDVRDGLKPVHRRILYAMYESGLTYDKKVRKCAAAVGDVLAHYHPHGDASVYDALVRLAQDFSMRYPLIHGQGNFGSIDGDPPAAYRYTESKMAKISDEMLRDIDKDTVDWDPNFDETTKEPRVLPSRFPNLLVNGSSGIAVGMATNIPPHNLTEVINAAVCVLENPDATVYELMQHVTGPDFPTKGIIMGRSGIRSAYATGRGKVVVRARTEFEEFGSNRTRIIVTELPYQVNKRMLIAAIADHVKDKKIEGISDLRDESDRTGMRIVIELKRDANPQIVLNQLLVQTQLQTTFSINMLALVDNQSQPRILSLKGILDEYIAFQKDVIVRRTNYDLKKALERAHLLEGLITAQNNIDEVVRIIRESYDDAKQNLCARFGLDDIQAQAILDMRLKQIQRLDREKLQAEYDELQQRISYYNELLADPEKIKGVLKDELIEIRDKFGDERVTEIQDVENEIDVEDLIPVEDCVVTLTKYGYVKRQPADTYRTQRRGGRGVSGMTRREEDFVTDMFTCSTHDFLLFFTTRGRVYRMKSYEIPESSRTGKGTNIINLLPLEAEEKVTSAIKVSEFDEEKFFCMVTRQGTIKRISFAAFKNIRKSGLIAIGLDDGDELAWVKMTDGNDELIVATHDGRAIRFNENDAREMGRNARGVRAIALEDGDYVIGMAVVRENCCLLTVSEKGAGRRTVMDEYPIRQRGGKGVLNFYSDKNGPVAGILTVEDNDNVFLIADDGVIIRIDVSDIAIHSRYSGGVRVMRLAEDSRLVSIAKAPVEDKEEESDIEADENEQETAEE